MLLHSIVEDPLWLHYSLSITNIVAEDIILRKETYNDKNEQYHLPTGMNTIYVPCISKIAENYWSACQKGLYTWLLVDPD